MRQTAAKNIFLVAVGPACEKYHGGKAMKIFDLMGAARTPTGAWVLGAVALFAGPGLIGAALVAPHAVSAADRTAPGTTEIPEATGVTVPNITLELLFKSLAKRVAMNEQRHEPVTHPSVGRGTSESHTAAPEHEHDPIDHDSKSAPAPHPHGRLTRKKPSGVDASARMPGSDASVMTPVVNTTTEPCGVGQAKMCGPAQ